MMLVDDQIKVFHDETVPIIEKKINKKTNEGLRLKLWGEGRIRDRWY